MDILVESPVGQIRDSFMPKHVMDSLAKLGNLTCNTTTEHMTAEELKKALEHTDILVTGWSTPKLTAEVIGDCKRLKMVAHTAGTVAPYVSKELYEKGVTVVCGNDIFARSVAEGALCYILFKLRDLDGYIERTKQGLWKDSQNLNNEGLFKKKIGIVGYGTISKYLCRLLVPFDVEILVSSSHLSQEAAAEFGGKVVSTDEIFATCDVISIHLAKNEKTINSITSKQLSLIKDNALLVNTARAEVIKQEDFINELAKNRFKAVLDVHYQEPIPIDSIFRTFENVTLIPHLGGPTMDMRPRAGEAVVEDIERFIKGEPLQYEVTGDTAGRMTV